MEVHLKIGLLAIQGAFSEHKACLIKAGDLIASEASESEGIVVKTDVIEVRTETDLQGLNGLIIPGGESTVISKSLQRNGFGETVKAWMKGAERPVIWGTCAGMILLANSIENSKTEGQVVLGGLDVEVSRNFFGRQIHSFEADVSIQHGDLNADATNPGLKSYHGVFIRAPAILSVNSSDVDILGTITHMKSEGEPVIVAVKQNNIMATAFHPELTDDFRWHKYFLQLILKEKARSN